MIRRTGAALARRAKQVPLRTHGVVLTMLLVCLSSMLLLNGYAHHRT
jgi:hypothetical protein